ncbi:MAG: Gfo/Idh/MocA family protein [Alphaproteobacteria bacterium]
MTKKLRLGVVGAGVFGGYHAGKCSAHDRIDFVGVYDPDHAGAKRQAAKHKVRAYAAYEQMLADVDAVIVAAPASHHGTMALKALDAGRHVLIEKPIADTVETAAQIVDLAERKKLIVQVGHQERFVLKAIGLNRVSEKPLQITGHRFSPYSARGTDVSVTLDLMTHDLDLVLWLMGSDPVAIEGESLCVRSQTSDAAFAKLKFKGANAHLEASRVEEASSRQMRVVYPSGTVDIDFNAKTLAHDTPFDLNADFGEDPMAKDSLGAATNAFVEAVLDGKPVAITGGNGLRALKAGLIVDGQL